LIYPVTDHDFTRRSHREAPTIGGLLSSADMAWFWDKYLPDRDQRDDPLASPLRAPSLAGLPPALVVTAELDPLSDEGEAYATALAREGVPTSHLRCHGLGHGFVRMPAVHRSTSVIAMVGSFIRSSLVND